jgi:hypothetical protein
VLVNVPFRRIINGQTVTFQSAGLSDKIGPIEPLSDGFSRARYQLPETRIYSSDGKYYVDGGVVKVVCVTATFGYWWGNFTRITLGAYRVYGYEEIVRISGTDDVGVTSGWAWYVSSSGFANGSSEGWSGALTTYFSSGGCTPHWDIWVDGKQICKDGQRVDQA